MELYRLTLGRVSTNCYFVYDKESKKALVVDPGDEAERIEGKLHELSLDPVAVLLTHGHFDHIMAAPSLKDAYGIPIYAAGAEAELLKDSHDNLTGPWGGRPLSIEADVWLSDQQKVELSGITFMVLTTPGHTKGGCCYYFPEDKVLLSGDTLFAGSYGRTDLPGGSAGDMARSVGRLLRELPEETAVFPGHGDETTIKREKQVNPLAPRLSDEKENK